MNAVKIATYNIWGFNEPWRYTLNHGLVRGAVPGSMASTNRSPSIWSRRCRLIVQALNEAQPDVIGLQEVREFPEQPGVHQAEQIAHDLGYHCAFAPLISDENDQERFVQGLAVLSCYEIRETHVIKLKAAGSATDWQQSVLHTVINTPQKALHLLTCHLTPRSEDAQLAAVEHILRYLATLPADQPRIVVGDFNAVPSSPTIQRMTEVQAGLHDAWQEAHPVDGGPTMPSELPTHRLDYIFIGNSFQIQAVERLGTRPDQDGFYPSDHLGVAATLHCF